MYLAPSPLEGRGIKPISRYLYAPVNTFGQNNGPLTLRLDAKDTKTKMTLHSRRVRHFNPVDTEEWVSSRDIFYVNCKQRAVKRNGYVCVKATPHASGVNEDYITCCVPTIKKHDETKSHYMLFRLIRAQKRDPRKREEEKEEGQDEPLGVRKWKKPRKSLSVDTEPRANAPAAHHESVGEDVVDSDPKPKQSGGGKAVGKGKERKKKAAMSEITEGNEGAEQ